MILKDSIYYALSQMISFSFSFFLIPIYTNILSPNDFGKYSLLMIYISLSTAFYNFGLNTSYMIRFYKETIHQNKINFTYVVIVILSISSFFLCSFLIFSSSVTSLISKYIFPIDSSNLYYILILITSLTLNAFFTSLIRVMQKAFHFFLYTSFLVVFNSMLSLYMLVYLKTGYYSLIYSSLIVNTVFSLVGFYYFRGYLLTRGLQITPPTKIFFKNTIPILFSQLSTISLNNINRIILERVSSANSLGIYAVGARFGNLIEPLLLTPVFNAFNPQAYKSYSADNEVFKKELIKFTLIYTLIANTVFLSASLFFEIIFKMLVNVAYWEGYNISIIILLSYLLLGYHNIFSIVYTVKEKLYFGFILTLITLGLNILLSYFMIKYFGIIGAAVANLSSTIIMIGMSYLYSNSLLEIKYPIKKIICTLILTGVFSYYANQISCKSLILVLLSKGLIFLVVVIFDLIVLLGWSSMKDILLRIKKRI